MDETPDEYLPDERRETTNRLRLYRALQAYETGDHKAINDAIEQFHASTPQERWEAYEVALAWVSALLNQLAEHRPVHRLDQFIAAAEAELAAL